MYYGTPNEINRDENFPKSENKYYISVNDCEKSCTFAPGFGMRGFRTRPCRHLIQNIIHILFLYFSCFRYNGMAF